MRFSRLHKALLVATVAGASFLPAAAQGATTPTSPVHAAAIPLSVPPGGGGYAWSDCVWGGAPQNGYVNGFWNNRWGIGLSLVCGFQDSSGNGFGVTHIYSGHGFDNYTESCIQEVVTNALSLGPASGSNNALLEYSKNGFTADVVYNTQTSNIVTAYTRGSNSGDWQTCSQSLS